MPLELWELAGQKTPAGQKALLNSDPHSAVLHLSQTYRVTQRESINTSLPSVFLSSVKKH